MRLSGHALDTESEHKLVKDEVTDADVGVVLPGAKAEVAVVNEVRHAVKVESLLRFVRYVEHVWLIPEGIKLTVEFAAVLKPWEKVVNTFISKKI